VPLGAVPIHEEIGETHGHQKRRASWDNGDGMSCEYCSDRDRGEQNTWANRPCRSNHQMTDLSGAGDCVLQGNGMTLSNQSTIPGSGDDDHDILTVFMGRTGIGAAPRGLAGGEMSAQTGHGTGHA
jgi:hypothetical protein